MYINRLQFKNSVQLNKNDNIILLRIEGSHVLNSLSGFK